MDNRILAFTLLAVLLSTTVSQAEDWWKVRLDQFNHQKFSKAVSRVDEHFRKVQGLTRLLAENSDNEHFRKRGFIYVSQVPEGKSVTFKVEGQKIAQYTILNWDTQHIGFPNLVTQLKGYGYVTQSEILKLRLENLRLKDAPESEIKKIEESLRNLEEEIKDFTSKTKWVD